jgi:hypothetical protein
MKLLRKSYKEDIFSIVIASERSERSNLVFKTGLLRRPEPALSEVSTKGGCASGAEGASSQ